MLFPSKKIILASKSPRRLELLKAMGLDFEVVLKDVDESYPDNLQPHEIALYIARQKAAAFPVAPDELIITADTIVALNGEILGKPDDHEHAKSMLTKLSGNTHQVFTGVCLVTAAATVSFFDETSVTFRSTTNEEIDYYISNFKPFDKAGSYGVQDWWGLTVVAALTGSYTNVMGLPTEKLYQQLQKLV